MTVVSPRKLVFIASGGSSGTHLLARLLSGYAPLRAGPELAVFHDRGLFQPHTYKSALVQSFMNKGETWTRTLSNGDCQDFIPRTVLMNRDFYGWDKPDELEWLTEHTRTLPELIDAILQRLQERKGWPEDALLIEHAPMSSLWLDQVVPIFPHSRIVHLVRDMRDAVSSMAVRRAMRPPIEGLPLRENVEVTVDQWVAFNAAALTMQGDPRYLRIRYEDLVTNVDKVIPQVLNHIFIGSANSEGIPCTLGEKDLGFSEQRGWKASPHQPVTTGSIGRYTELLDPQAVAAMFDREVQLPSEAQSIRAGDMQLQFGYPVSPE